MIGDRVERLERAFAEIQRQIAGLPVRFGDSGTGSGGSETLGCHLVRVGGALTINLETLVGDGLEVGDETPCKKIHAVGGVLPPSPSVRSFLVFTPGVGNQWEEPPKTLVRGYTTLASKWDDSTYSMKVTDLLAGTQDPGVDLIVRKHFGAAALGVTPYANRRAFRAGEIVFAVWNDTDSDWDDITPSPGLWITAILTHSVPAAEWNQGGKSLQPKPFKAYWYSRSNGFPGTQKFLFMSEIDAENRSLDPITLEPGKAIVISLVYSDGVYTIPVPADCPTFTY